MLINLARVIKKAWLNEAGHGVTQAYSTANSHSSDAEVFISVGRWKPSIVVRINNNYDFENFCSYCFGSW